MLDVFEKGTQYTVTAWVRLADGAAADSARLSVERHTAGVASYDQVAGNTAVSAGAWVALSGRYTLATDVDFLRVYVETADTTGSFFVDDVTVSYVPALPIQTDIPRIRDVVTEFPVGAAITAAETLGVHGELLARHFTSVTPRQRAQVGRHRARPRTRSATRRPIRSSRTRRQTIWPCAATPWSGTTRRRPGSSPTRRVRR
nr:hypothetical protein GCM10020092_062650 [Actinoplanes digitatis]